MKKYLLSIGISIIFLILLSGCSNATTGDVVAELKNNNVKPGEEIEFTIKAVNNIKLYSLEADINYDENIIEKITTTYNGDYNNVTNEDFSLSGKHYSLFFDNVVEASANSEIVNVKLKLKDSITDTSGIISLENVAYTNEDFDDIYFEGEISRIEFSIKQDPKPDPDPEPEDLYLSTPKYKIGEEDTENYVEGDTNIYRISPNTTITDFISNLSTNGNISVYNANGEEEANYDELVKTGMIIKVSKDNKEIELTISVLGDTNGDGIADITDLVDVRKHIQEVNAITKKEILLSVDINEDGIIDITDLVKIRKHIQEVEML